MGEVTNRLTMYQVAEMLNTSHTTIYSKMNNEEIKKDLENFIIHHGKARYLKPEGVDILRKYMKDGFDKPLESDAKVLEDVDKHLEIKDNTNNKDNGKSVDSIDNKTLELFIKTLESNNKEYIENLNNRIEDLNKQLDAKEKALESKDSQIEKMTLTLSEALETSNKLNENNQILLGRMQDNNVMLIESAQQEKSKWSLFNIFKKS